MSTSKPVPPVDARALAAAYYRAESARPTDEPYSQGDILFSAPYRSKGSSEIESAETLVVITQTCEMANAQTPRHVELLRIDRLDELLCADAAFSGKMDALLKHRITGRHFIPGHPDHTVIGGVVWDLVVDLEDGAILTWDEFVQAVPVCRRLTLADNAARHLAQRYAERFNRVPLSEIPEYRWETGKATTQTVTPDGYRSAAGGILHPTLDLEVQVMSKEESGRNIRLFVALLLRHQKFSAAGLSKEAAIVNLLNQIQAAVDTPDSEHAAGLVALGKFQ